jgi:hypothetical protein
MGVVPFQRWPILDNGWRPREPHPEEVAQDERRGALLANAAAFNDELSSVVPAVAENTMTT